MNWMQRYKQRIEQENPQSKPTPQAFGVSEPLTKPTRTPAAVNHSTPSSVATEPSQEREPGEDDAGIDGKWPPPAWSLADWVKGARGDFHVFEGLFGVKPISRGFSWKD